MKPEVRWDVCPSMKTNFKCYLKFTGRWDRTPHSIDENSLKGFGKCIFIIIPKTSRINAPTFGDQRNFFTGLFEAEWENDNFIQNGLFRPPQRLKKIKMFGNIINEISLRPEIKDTHRGIDFYRGEGNADTTT